MVWGLTDFGELIQVFTIATAAMRILYVLTEYFQPHIVTIGVHVHVEYIQGYQENLRCMYQGISRIAKVIDYMYFK